MRDVFEGYHPIVNLVWFAAVLAFSMFFTHPVCLAVSFLCAIVYSRFKGLLYLLPLILVTALINPAFNHAGATILAYLPGGNPLTLESILYGAAAAVMLVTVISWCSRLNAVISSDKLTYLFGRVIPALSLVFSMSLRFVPRFLGQVKAVSNARRGLGEVPGGNVIKKAKYGLRTLSVTVTWALENAVETADSMRARGYGLPGRTAFSIYRFDGRDAGALAFTVFCAAYVIAGAVRGALEWRYFPTVGGTYPTDVFAAYLALCAMPIFLNVREDFRWRAIESKI
ncbi:cobalt transporter [Clostridia bacterium]|nr:cobalt transporter [Clostridia bacterium]